MPAPTIYPRLVLGTAGHIDHGKTALVKALTGINTDRLKEEQERGMTIELGFAHLKLPNGMVLGVVDVPGHEKFVKTMVAGAAGIDMVMLVVAADDGVMPQTREHLAICELLRVKRGLVAINKIDLADKELLGLLQEEIRELTRGTFLEGCPLLEASAVSGAGIPELAAALQKMALEVEERPLGGLFRMPIDRVFTMKGFGTVITGSPLSGRVRVGEQLEILPSALTARVRGLQVHGQAVEEAAAGQRTAINLQAIEKDILPRGEVAVKPDTYLPSGRLDVLLKLLPSAEPLANYAKVRFHAGTASCDAKIVLYEEKSLPPGASAVSQLRLETPMVVGVGDRFVLRSSAHLETVGGGDILDNYPPRHKRRLSPEDNWIDILKRREPRELIRYYALAAGNQGISFREISCRLWLSPKELESLLAQILSARELIQYDAQRRLYLSVTIFNGLKVKAVELLAVYHKNNPLKIGMPLGEWMLRVAPRLEERVLQKVLQDLLQEKKVVQEEDKIRLTAHQPGREEAEKEILAKLERIYREQVFTPPYTKEIAEQEKLWEKEVRQAVEHLVSRGVLAHIKGDLFLHREHLEALRKKMLEFFASHPKMSTGDFKEMTGASRKYVIPLLEYFDAARLTLRIGDERTLRTSNKEG